jgi:regulator of protease activity HflC (stomatin/prohibitin superfamily)
MKTVLIAAASALCLAACSQVQPGHVGIKVNQYGSASGVEPEPLGVGTYWTGPGVHIYQYPVSTVTHTWTRSRTEGSANDDSFNFQSNEGLPINADVGVSFSVDPSRAPILFQKYRVSIDSITDGPLRNEVRSSLIKYAAQYGVGDLYGNKKAELLARAQSEVQSFFAPFGLHIESLFWADLRFPESVARQIEQRISNEQAALAAQAQVATVQAQAAQRAAQAQGDATATNLQGAALRANPEVLRLRAIEKWDGHLPQVTSGGTPLISLSGDK